MVRNYCGGDIIFSQLQHCGVTVPFAAAVLTPIWRKPLPVLLIVPTHRGMPGELSWVAS